LKYIKNYLTKSHIFLFLAMLIVFMIWTFLIVDGGLDKGEGHRERVLLTTVGTIAGPFTGAISRNFQGCCLQFSLFLAACCAPILLIGLAVQFLGPTGGKLLCVMRMMLWILGWLAWFMGGIVSFLHALS
jgi:hypothetical protein